MAIRGIYIDINLNTAKIKEETKQFTATLLNEFKKVNNYAVEPNFNFKPLEGVFNRLVKNAAYVKNEVEALGRTNATANLIRDTSRFSDEMQKLIDLTGLEDKELRKMMSAAVEATANKGIANSFKAWARDMGLVGEQAIAVAQKMGITGQALDLIKGKAASTTSDLSKAKEALGALIVQGGHTTQAFRNLTAEFDKLEKVKSEVALFDSMNSVMQRTGQEAVDLAKKLGMSSDAIDILSKRIKQVEPSVSPAQAALKEFANTLGISGAKLKYMQDELSNVEHMTKYAQQLKLLVDNMVMSRQEAEVHAKKLGIYNEILKKVGLTVEDTNRKQKDQTATVSASRQAFDTLIMSSTASQRSLDSLNKEFSNREAIKQWIAQIDSMNSVLGYSGQKLVDLARNMGAPKAVLRELAKRIPTVQTTLTGLEKALQDVGRYAGVSAADMQKFQAVLANNTAEKQKIQALKDLMRAEVITAEQAQAFAQKMGLSARAIQSLVPATVQAESALKKLMDQMRNMVTTGNFMAAMQSSLATLGANLSVAGLVELMKSSIDVAIKVDSLTSAFTAIYKESHLAGIELEYVRRVTNELGLEFYSTAGAAKKFFAAANTSGLKDKAEQIFHAFSAASSALKLTADETNGVFLAISQMMSKGKISAEELRQQLAERLPGAVQLLAKAMGVTTQKLDDMLQKGQVGLENLALLANEMESLYGKAGAEASNQLLGQMNKLKTAWTDFKSAIFSSETVSKMFAGLNTAVTFLKDNTEKLTKALNALLTMLIVHSGMRVFKKLIEEIATGGLVSLSTALTSVTGKVRAFGTAFASATGVMQKAAVAAPLIGIALTVAAGAYTLFHDNTKKASEIMEEFIERGKKLQETTEDVADSVEKAAKKTGAAMSDIIKSKISDVKVDMEKARSNIISGLEEITERVKKSKAGSITFELDTSVDDAQLNIITKLLDGVKGSADKGRLSFAELQEVVRTAKDRMKEFGAAANSNDFMDFLLGLEEAIKNGGNLEDVVAALTNKMADLANKAKEAAVSINEAFTITPVKSVEDKLNQQLISNAYAGKNQKNLQTLAKGLASSIGKTEFIDSPDLTGNIATRVRQANLSEISPIISMIEKGSIKSKSDFMKEVNKLSSITSSGQNSQLEYLWAQYQGGLLSDAQKASSGSKGAKATENKRNSAKAKIDAYEGELARLKDQNQYATDSFQYAWEGTTKTVTDAKKKIAEFSNKYSEVIDKSKLQAATEALTQQAYEKQYAQRQKLLQEWLSKTNDALDFYYEKHGMVNERILADLKKNYENQLAALDQMHETGFLKEEEYLERKKALNEKYAYDTERQKGGKDGALYGDFSVGVNKAWDQLKADALDLEKIGQNLTSMTFDNFTNAFVDVAMGSKTAAAAFEDMGKTIVKQLVAIAAKMMIIAILQKSMGGLFGGGMASTPSSGAAMPTMNTAGGWAKGGAFSGSTLSAFENGVYNTPTQFGGGSRRYANGGVFGEAGPEAIMPLTRMSNGRLGVAAVGGGGDVKVNVYNYGNDKATASSSTSSSGGKTIDIIIGDMVAQQMSTPGTRLNRTVSSQTGSKSPVIRR